MAGYEGCPSRIYDYTDFVGENFVLGAAGGSAFHFVKGLHGAPGGARLAGAVHAVRANAPRVAGTFGAFCIAFTVIEGAVSLARGKEDGWSSAAAAAVTWGLHGLRQGGGAPAAARGALLGAVGFFAMVGFDHAATLWQIRRADADLLRRKKRMMDSGKPTPVAIAASRTAPGVPHDGDDDHCRWDGFSKAHV